MGRFAKTFLGDYSYIVQTHKNLASICLDFLFIVSESPNNHACEFRRQEALNKSAGESEFLKADWPPFFMRQS